MNRLIFWMTTVTAIAGVTAGAASQDVGQSAGTGKSEATSGVSMGASGKASVGEADTGKASIGGGGQDQGGGYEGPSNSEDEEHKGSNEGGLPDHSDPATK